MATGWGAQKPLSLLKERDFSLLLSGQLISALGDKINYIALGILVFRATGSALAVGKMTIATLLPYLLFGLIAGVYVDRWDKKKTMIVSDVLRACLVALIPWVIGVSINLVYVITFLVTTVSLFFGPAKMAVIPTLFAREKIIAATSLAETVENVTEIAGYALAGVVAVIMTLDKVFYLDAATFVVSALTITLMQRGFGQETSRIGSAVWQDIKEGIAFIGQTKALLVTLVSYCVVLLIFSGFNPLIFVYALHTLHTSSLGLGVLEAMHAVGITVGGIVISVIGTPGGKGKWITGGYLVSGATIAMLGLLYWYPLALVGFLFTGFSNAMFFMPIQAIFQELTPANMRGRVFSARFAVTRVAFMASVAILTFAANWVGVEKVYFVAGVTLTVVALVTLSLKSLCTIA
ncbi:MAG: MFS transporter [Peptococcaceae bacterium]|nr:MFS transporter [Peptococcaceae bacterium]